MPPGSAGHSISVMNVSRNSLGDKALSELVRGLASVPTFKRTLKTLIADSNGASVATFQYQLLLQGIIPYLHCPSHGIELDQMGSFLANGLFENVGLTVLNLA